MKTRLCHAMQGQGVLCVSAARPLWSVRRGGKETHGLAARGEQPSQRASAPRAGAAPVDRPSPTRILPDADLARKGTRQPGEVRAGSRQSKTTGEGDPRSRDGSRDRGGGREGDLGGAQGDRSVVRGQRRRSQASTDAGSAEPGKTTGWLDGPSWTGFLVGGGGLPRQRHCTGTDAVGETGDEGVRLLCEEAGGIGGPAV